MPPIIPEKFQRKYTCFCCGVMFSSFDEYKNHIIDKHNEGTDYIICPLPHCLSPIRDLNSHFRLKHPSETPPKNCQATATLWRDFTIDGKLKKKKPKFKTGEYQSKKMNRALHYRSGFEEKIYRLLDEDIEVLSYAVEPYEIDYLYKGEAHKYSPDIEVRYINNKVELWEIKQQKETLFPKNKAKWQMANEFCKIRNIEFKVITEVGMDFLKKKVQRQKALLND